MVNAPPSRCAEDAIRCDVVKTSFRTRCTRFWPWSEQEDWDQAATLLRQSLRQILAEVSGMSPQELVEQRYRKFRQMGNFFSEGGL
ncbi:MAG: hypothetical protein FJW34_00885 [Acidobacteria bacterium]|nr:hypothetical protein [Acidobacteriota bacterium]